ELLQRLCSPGIFIIEDSPHGWGAGAGGREICSLELRSHSVVKVKPRRRRRLGIEGGEYWNNDSDSLKGKAEIVPQQFRKRPNFSVNTHLLQLSTPEKLKRMLKHARHFPCRRRNACNGHDRMAIDLQN